MGDFTIHTSHKHYLPAFLTFLLEYSDVLNKRFDYDDNQMLKDYELGMGLSTRTLQAVKLFL